MTDIGDSHPFVQLSFPRRRESMFSREVDSHLRGNDTHGAAETMTTPRIIIVNLTICHTREGGYPFSFGAVDSRLRGNDS